MVQEDKVSKIDRFGTLTFSIVSQDSEATMPENQGITHVCCQNEANIYPKLLPSCGIFEMMGESHIGFDLYQIGLKKRNLNSAWHQKLMIMTLILSVAMMMMMGLKIRTLVICTV